MNKITPGLVLAVLILLSLHLSVKAQDPNGIQIPKVIPPNPASQEFQKFLGYPVTAATGLVDLSIPLYNLQLPGISIPLTLKYHSSGIKVEQSYGTLGYGWTMFPQFKITRTVMGKPDEFFTTASMSPSNSDYLAFLVDMAPSADGSSNNGGGGTTKDGQFDVFSISLPNYNGNFILERDGTGFKAVSIPDAPLKITVTDTYLRSFEVMDDKGIRYVFNDLSGNVPITDWMLTQIILPGNNNQITLQYAIGGNQANILSDYSLTVWDEMKDDYVANCDDQPAVEAAFGIGASATDMNTYAYQYNATPSMGFPPTYNLKSIQFATGNIQMTYGSSFNELQNITIYNASQQALKTISFTQSSDHQLLQKVAISGEGEYKLEYNPRHFQYLYDQDIWGYYNNPNNNGALNPSMVPQMMLNVRNYIAGQDNTYPVQFGYANQLPDTAAMKANSLQKITYPTGGWSCFYYEPNQFLHNNFTTYGGGLRINQIDTYDPVSAKMIIKTYKYGANESGLGNLLAYPENDSFIDECFLYGFSNCEGTRPVRGRRRTLNPHSRYRYYNLNFPVWYDKVAEYTDGGKIMYEYKYTADEISFSNNYQGVDDNFGDVYAEHNVDVLNVMNNLAMSSPELTKKQIYKSENGTYSLLRQEDYTFTLSSSQQLIQGLIVKPMCYIYRNGILANQTWLYNTYPPYDQIGNGNPFTSLQYYIQPGINNLTSINITDYSNGQATTTTTTNNYDTNYPYNKILTQTNRSDGTAISQNLYYPTSTSIPNLTSAQQTMVNTLNSNNRLTTLIEKVTSKNTTTPLFGELYCYRDWGNSILEPEYVYTKTNTNAYEPRLQYLGYDDHANLQSVAKINGPATSYQWGYNYTYPVAQATNAKSNDIFYDSFEEGNGNSGDAKTGHFSHTGSYTKSLANLDNQYYTLTYWLKSGGVWSLQTSSINVTTGAYAINLNNQIDDVRFYPSNAQMTTYTYDPLVGMTSATDAKGQTTYYEYDVFQRLMNIKDKDGNIIKSFTYHYQGQ